MKLNRKILKKLIKQEIKIISESQADLSNRCPRAAQDQIENKENKALASRSQEIKYGHPKEVPALNNLKESGRICGNCSAFNVSKKMIACKGATSDKRHGYCEMHRFICKSEKTCLKHEKGGPKTEWNSE